MRPRRGENRTPLSNEVNELHRELEDAALRHLNECIMAVVLADDYARDAGKLTKELMKLRDFSKLDTELLHQAHNLLRDARELLDRILSGNCANNTT